MSALAAKLLWPFTSLGSAYVRAAERRPFVVGVLTTGIKTSLADLFAQKVMEKREKVDWTRQAAFTFFGFAYLGAFQYAFYTRVLGPLTSPITRSMGHIASSPVKTFIDQAIHHPFAYFPAFYYLKYTLVKGEDSSVALEKYQEDLWSNCTALWSIWVPAQLLNFSVVPRYLQIPYAAAVSFVWTIVLSTMRGNFEEAKAADSLEPAAESQVTAASVTPLPPAKAPDAAPKASPAAAAAASQPRVEASAATGAASGRSAAACVHSEDSEPAAYLGELPKRVAAASPLERRQPWGAALTQAWGPGLSSAGVSALTAHAASHTSALLALQHPLGSSICR